MVPEAFCCDDAFCLWHTPCFSFSVPTGSLHFMKIYFPTYLRVVILSLVLGMSHAAFAHPGPPGHTHYPDEVDEFEQVAMPIGELNEQRDINVGGMIALSLIGVCLAFALLQKNGGIWKDSTIRH